MEVEINILNSQDPNQIFYIEKEHYDDIVIYQSLFLDDAEGREAAYCYLVNADFRPAITISKEVISSIPEHKFTKLWEQLIEKRPAMQTTVYEFLVLNDEECNEYRAVALLGQSQTIKLVA